MDYYIYTDKYRYTIFLMDGKLNTSRKIDKINLKHVLKYTVTRLKDKMDSTDPLGKFFSNFSSKNYILKFQFGKWGERQQVEFYFKKESELEILKNEIDKGLNHIRSEEKKLRKQKEKIKKEDERIRKEKWLKKQEEKRIKEIKRKELLKKDVSDISKEFDTDSDGIIDFNQGQDDFMNLLKKHQVSIIDIDQNHITKFIQVSNYLKIKRENIQKQFEKIKTSKNTNQLKEFTGVLKNQIDTFNLLSYNSMIMIISLVEKDLLTFNEIYLTLDKLNIFNSNWENEVSNKLENIGSKLDDLIFSINKMEISITNEILKMSIMNQINLNRLNKSVSQGNMMINDSLKSLNSSLSSNLKSIGSKINLNNLLTGINTYQLYTLNKKTKSLRS